MHYFAQIINTFYNDKFYVKLFMQNNLKYKNPFCNNFARLDEINNNTIVVYPEIVSCNPLNAKNVVRWILLELGIEMPVDHYKLWSKGDCIYHWETNHTLSNYKQLCCPWLNPIFCNKNIPQEMKEQTCYLIKKGRLIHKQITIIHPSDSICIDDLSLSEINEVFNNCKYFYCYDPNSAYVIFSLICGCIPIIQPIEGINEEEFFKSRIYNFKGTIYKKGIVYGGVNKINYILENKLNTNNNEYYKNLFDKYKETIPPFLNDLSNLVHR